MNISKVTIFGAGTLGSQVAFHTAFHDFDVTVYDINDNALEKAGKRFQELAQTYKQYFDTSEDTIEATHQRLHLTTDLEEAIKDADIASESVPEDLKIKKNFYSKLSQAAPDKTILTTNSSTMVPSQFAKETGRPKRFLAMHFANNIWQRNIAEIMGHPDTDQQVFDTVIEFAEDIGMIPLPIKKEQNGYLLNSLLVPLLDAAGNLLVNEVADPQTIDKAWMIGTGAPLGPFAILDTVGLTTAYNITKMNAAANPGNEKLKQLEKYYKENFIDKNKLGISTGKGFYTYPDPAYKDPDFLKE